MSSRLIAHIRLPRDEGRAFVLTLRDIKGHPGGAGALEELGITYAISEDAGGLLLIKRSADLRLYLYNVEGVLRAARRNAEQRGREASRASASRAQGNRYGPEDLVSGTSDLAYAQQIIVRLEARIAQLQTTRAEVVEQREHWKRRATRAEEKLNTGDAAGSDGIDVRYPALRRFLAKRFHPDQAPGDGTEKIIRNEIFKEIWVEIVRIDTADR
jgi:hypothetical protein